MNLTIRSYREDDLDAVMRIWYEASKVGHPFLSEQALKEDRQEILDTYLPIARQWVCEVDGVLVGFIALLEDHIGGLFVDPLWHRKGIGTTLVSHVKPMYSTLSVAVFKDNPNGIRFYEKCGFHRIGERIHEASGLIELLMETD